MKIEKIYNNAENHEVAAYVIYAKATGSEGRIDVASTPITFYLDPELKTKATIPNMDLKSAEDFIPLLAKGILIGAIYNNEIKGYHAVSYMSASDSEVEIRFQQYCNTAASGEAAKYETKDFNGIIGKY